MAHGDARKLADAELTSRHVRAWLLLVVALACHVVDEALTGFLDFYNPLVLSVRSRITWFPMPTFAFDVWLSGLAALVVVLALLAPAVRKGGAGAVLASWVFSAIMMLNGIGHLAGSVYFGRWLPGTTSSPLLLVTSVLLARTAWARRGDEARGGVGDDSDPMKGGSGHAYRGTLRHTRQSACARGRARRGSS